ncbi:MAG: type III secretion system export apparatus subunit SctV, partial [Myxococcales bacterium]|nr:type III secretion system export apparatus subunit SctV [Myxococcales bacterium]
RESRGSRGRLATFAICLAVGVAAIIAMLILPLPSMLVDGLLATNLALGAVILVAVLLSQRPLSISTFPTLLLITTLFRLALNVSTTRMILAHGTAGEVVKAFGQFVIRGDVVVGLVVFLIITLVQFLVIGKGAERVAEVGARFTLDAMPGKQMSIDAALRAGSIDEQEAQRKRDDLGRESQFYGAMDGAMKFVKGDAVAGLVITALNLIAGLIIGVVRNGMDAGTAAEVYSILTVGDGLVSQIPALLITLSAGVLTTRVASKDANQSLGGNLQEELLSSPKVLAIGAGFAMALGMVPGLPVLPFTVIAAALASAAFIKDRRTKQEAKARDEQQSTFKKSLDERRKQAAKQRTELDDMAPGVTPLALDCDPTLSQALGMVGTSENPLLKQFSEMRTRLYADTGVRIPTITVRINDQSLRPGEFRLRVKDVPVYTGSLDATRIMAVESPAKLKRMGVDAVPFQHPVFFVEVALVPPGAAEGLNGVGVRTHTSAEVMAMLMGSLIKKELSRLLGLHETADLVERLEKVYPTSVREVVPKLITVSRLAEILRRLVDEGISIRDMKTILECLAEAGAVDADPVGLTERVRAALGHQIAHCYAGPSGNLKALLLDGLVEDTIQSAIVHTTNGSYLALEPELNRMVLVAIGRAAQPIVASGNRPVILTRADIRRYLQRMLAAQLSSEFAVLSFDELPGGLNITPMGRVTLPDELPEAA